MIDYDRLVSALRLGIDYGTSNTAAVLQWSDGRTQQLLFDGSPLLPSAVHLDATGRILAGVDAVHSARAQPERCEPNPKRRVGEGDILLGDTAVPIVDAVAATLSRVAAEAARVAGGPVGALVITHPANWGTLRRTVLTEAAARAGLPVPGLVPEPVAAAAYFATRSGRAIDPGRMVIVFDLGAGTLDVSAVRRTNDGLQVCEIDGLDNFGGLDLDALLVHRISAAISTTAPETWQQLSRPTTPEHHRAVRTLWEDARVAKEVLSRQPSTIVCAPITSLDVLISREELEAAAAPPLLRAAELTATLMRRAGVAPDNLAGLFLVGGASRMPLVATLLHRATGVAPLVLEQPELAVAQGALFADTPTPAATERLPWTANPLQQQVATAASPPPVEPTRQAGSVDVVLTAVGRRMISVVKVVRDQTGMGLNEATALVRSVPQPVLRHVDPGRARQAAAAFEQAGAVVALVESGGGFTVPAAAVAPPHGTAAPTYVVGAPSHTTGAPASVTPPHRTRHLPIPARYTLIGVAFIMQLVGFFALPWLTASTPNGTVSATYPKVANGIVQYGGSALNWWQRWYGQWTAVPLAILAVLIAAAAVAHTSRQSANQPARPPWLPFAVLITLTFGAFMGIPYNTGNLGIAPGVGSALVGAAFLLLAGACPAPKNWRRR